MCPRLSRFTVVPVVCPRLSPVIVSGTVFGYEFYRLEAGPIPLTIDRGLWLAVMCGFAASIVAGRSRIRAFDRTDWLVMGLLGILTISTLVNDWSFRNNLPLSRLLFFAVMPIGLYFLAKNAAVRAKDLRWIAFGLTLLGLYLAFTAVAEINGWWRLVFPAYIRSDSYAEFFGRGRGPLLNPVSNGIFMVVALTTTWIWFQNSRWFGRLPIGIVVGCLLTLGIYSTLTRSIWLMAVLACIAFVWVGATFRHRVGIVVAGGLLGLIVAATLSSSLIAFKRDKNVTETQMAQSAKLRPIFAKVAWEMFKDRPVWGFGFGQYTRAKIPYLKDAHSALPLTKAKPYMQHNVFLSYLTELGIVGMAWLIILLGKLFLVSWKLTQEKSLESWQRGFGLLMFVTLVGYVVNGMFHDTSILPMMHMLMFFLAGIASNIYRSFCDQVSAGQQMSLEEAFGHSHREEFSHAAA